MSFVNLPTSLVVKNSVHLDIINCFLDVFATSRVLCIIVLLLEASSNANGAFIIHAKTHICRPVCVFIYMCVVPHLVDSCPTRSVNTVIPENISLAWTA